MTIAFSFSDRNHLRLPRLCGILVKSQTQRGTTQQINGEAMCSIFGEIRYQSRCQRNCVKAYELSRLMRHRGPDWSGIFMLRQRDSRAERLSIVGVNAGAEACITRGKPTCWR